MNSVLGAQGVGGIGMGNQYNTGDSITDTSQPASWAMGMWIAAVVFLLLIYFSL